MANCVFCDKSGDEHYKYYTLNVCKRCYFRLKIKKLKSKGPPVDEYMKSLVEKDDSVYVDALNLYSTLFPRSLSQDLFGIFLANLDDEDMDDIFINSMIVAARSIWLFGKDTHGRKKIRSEKIHALHVFGNLIGVSIIGRLTDAYRDLDLDDGTNLSRLYDKINLTIIDILKDLQKHDDGTLRGYIEETTHLIHASEMFV